jgi:hypothetical protein
VRQWADGNGDTVQDQTAGPPPPKSKGEGRIKGCIVHGVGHLERISSQPVVERPNTVHSVARQKTPRQFKLSSKRVWVIGLLFVFFIPDAVVIIIVMPDVSRLSSHTERIRTYGTA